MNTEADQLRERLSFETDAPVTGTFRRDTHLTDVALFKAKVLAVLEGYRCDDRCESVMPYIIRRIDEIKP